MTTRTSRDAAIVYGVYINADADWRKLIWLQLKDLRRYGVLSVSDLYVVVSNPTRTEGVASFFDALPIPIKHIEFHDENKFEYPAISYIWNLASSHPDYKYIAYLHTKGMSYAKHQRDKIEKVLTHFTFSQWRKIFQVFEKRQNISKIGLFPAGDSGEPRGWIWFNFWWARSSLIRALPKPEQTQDRYYYELWLGLDAKAPEKHDCYSTWGDNDAIFTPDEVGAHIVAMRWKMRYGPFYKARRLFTPLHHLRRKLSRRLRGSRVTTS